MLLMIDNYDSFTWNLVQYFQALGQQVLVKRNDELSLTQIRQLAPDYLVISPGPGTPDQAGISLAAIEHFAGKMPILGVCLGHQAIAQVLVATPAGYSVPLIELAEIRYERGPQMIRSENNFLTAYITFGAERGIADVEAVAQVEAYLQQLLSQGELTLPAGVSYQFAGSYQQQQSAAATLSWLVPLALTLVFMLLYLQFKQVSTALMIFSSIAIAWAGGFIALDAFAQPDFLNSQWFGANLRELFNLQSYNLSIAVWVGFLALFGIAVDDGIVMATYLKQQFAARPARSRAEVRELVCAAAAKRIRPCLMTSATTILALLPVLSSTGRGADLMIPMAIPTLGGMLFVLLSVFMVPVLYAAREEWRLRD